jgi:hypothetical protein
MNQSASNWLINISLIEPSHSAILGGNHFLFYIIHTIAICVLITFLLSCLFVIISILSSKQKSLDFADRFPLYLAIADGLWGISHLTDHLIVLTTHTIPQ